MVGGDSVQPWPVVISCSGAGASLSNLPGCDEWAMVGISLIGYQSAFWITYLVRRVRG